MELKATTRKAEQALSQVLRHREANGELEMGAEQRASAGVVQSRIDSFIASHIRVLTSC